MEYTIVGTRASGKVVNFGSYNDQGDHAVKFAAVAKQYPRLTTLEARTNTGTTLLKRERTNKAC